MTVGDLELLLRPMVPTDEAYVMRSAVNAVRMSEHHRRTDGDRFHATVGQALRDAISSAPVRTVACIPEDPDLIVAFCAGIPGLPPILHYLHVRGNFRGQGIATALAREALNMTPQTLTIYTFSTPDIERLRLRGRAPNLTYRSLS